VKIGNKMAKARQYPWGVVQGMLPKAQIRPYHPVSFWWKEHWSLDGPYQNLSWQSKITARRFLLKIRALQPRFRQGGRFGGRVV